MLIEEVGKGGIESALKKLKRKLDKAKMAKELRSRKEFVKTSDKKRATKASAIYINKRFRLED